MNRENHLTEDEPTGDTSGIDADALMEQIENGQEISPEATNAADTPEPNSQQNTDPTPTPASEFEITWNGKKIPADRNRMTQWAQQGYDYNQKMAEFKRQQMSFEQQQQELEQQYSPFKQIDDYAKQNPEWWTFVEQQWHNRSQFNPSGDQSLGDPDVSQMIGPLQEKLNSLEKFKTDFEAAQAQQIEQEADAQLDQEVTSIREKYSNLDWDNPDESGLTLEQRVLKHSIDSGISTFKAAFNDLMQEELIRRARDEAKEETQKELQKRSKLGLLGKSSTPQQGLKPAEGVKGKSYESLLEEAMAEYQIG